MGLFDFRKRKELAKNMNQEESEETSIIEKLHTYTGISKDLCHKILNEKNGIFWLALYELSKPANPKDHYLDKLKNSGVVEEIISLLEILRNFYYNKNYSNLKSKILDLEPDFFDQTWDKEFLHLDPVRPTSDASEIEQYTALLKHEDVSVVSAVMEIVHWLPAASYSEEMVVILNGFMLGKDYSLADNSLRMLFDDPDKIALFLPALKKNLAKSRSSFHFSAVRAFWRENAPVYEEIIPLLKDLFEKSKNDQVKDMANDILLRYGVFSKEASDDKILKARNREIKKIQKYVSQMQTSKALHDFAEHFNWDDDLEYLKAVLMHEKCMKATALLIYWRSRPTSYLQYAAASEVPEYLREGFELQEIIEARIQQGMYRADGQPWDPQNDHGFDLTEENLPKDEKKRAIPAEMYEVL